MAIEIENKLAKFSERGERSLHVTLLFRTVFSKNGFSLFLAMAPIFWTVKCSTYQSTIHKGKAGQGKGQGLSWVYVCWMPNYGPEKREDEAISTWSFEWRKTDHVTLRFSEIPESQEIYRDLAPLPRWKTLSIMSLREWINRKDVLNWFHVSQWVNTKIRTGTQDFRCLPRTLPT